MPTYKGLSNISEEARNRLMELATKTGDAAVLIEDEGSLITPISTTVDFQGINVVAIPTEDRTHVLIDGGQNAPNPYRFGPTVETSVVAGAYAGLGMFRVTFSVGLDWSTTALSSVLEAQRTGTYLVTANIALRKPAAATPAPFTTAILLDGVAVLEQSDLHIANAVSVGHSMSGLFQVTAGQQFQIALNIDPIYTSSLVFEGPRSSLTLIRVD